MCRGGWGGRGHDVTASEIPGWRAPFPPLGPRPVWRPRKPPTVDPNRPDWPDQEQEADQGRLRRGGARAPSALPRGAGLGRAGWGRATSSLPRTWHIFPGGRCALQQSQRASLSVDV